MGRAYARSVLLFQGVARAAACVPFLRKRGAHSPFFIAGRQKGDPGSDFTQASVAQAQVIGEALQRASIRELDILLSEGLLKEICHDEEN